MSEIRRRLLEAGLTVNQRLALGMEIETVLSSVTWAYPSDSDDPEPHPVFIPPDTLWYVDEVNYTDSGDCKRIIYFGYDLLTLTHVKIKGPLIGGGGKRHGYYSTITDVAILGERPPDLVYTEREMLKHGTLANLPHLA